MDLDTPTNLNGERTKENLSPTAGPHGDPAPSFQKESSNAADSRSSTTDRCFHNKQVFSNSTNFQAPSLSQRCEHEGSPHIKIIDHSDVHSKEQDKLLRYCSSKVSRKRNADKPIPDFTNRDPDYIGGSSKVFLLEDENGRPYIVKEIKDVFKANEVISLNEIGGKAGVVQKVLEVILLPEGEVRIRMEWIKGETLSVIKDRLNQQQNSDLIAPFALEFLKCALSDIVIAHEAEWTHNDINEFNILVVPLENNEMTTKLIDFETAKPAKPDDPSLKDIDDLIGLFKELYIGHTEEMKTEHKVAINKVEEAYNEMDNFDEMDKFIQLIVSALKEIDHEDYKTNVFRCLFRDQTNKLSLKTASPPKLTKRSYAEAINNEVATSNSIQAQKRQERTETEEVEEAEKDGKDSEIKRKRF